MDLNDINLQALEDVLAVIARSGATHVHLGGPDGIEADFPTLAAAPAEQFLGPAPAVEGPSGAIGAIGAIGGAIVPSPRPEPRPTGYAGLFKDGKLPSFTARKAGER